MIIKVCENGKMIDMEVENTIDTDKMIQSLKNQLCNTDYEAIKHSEGWITDEDYKTTREMRQSLRDQINQLESTLE